MPRARNIKPGFFKNEYLAELPPLTRLLFVGLWTLSDKEGRLEDRPKKIKAEILPYDECDVNQMLNELMSSKEQFVIRYEVGGDKYIQITNFLKHQTPHHKEEPSIIPAFGVIDSIISQACVKHEPIMNQDCVNQIASCPTDSLILIPDSLILNTDSLSKEPNGSSSDESDAGDEPGITKDPLSHQKKVDSLTQIKQTVEFYNQHRNRMPEATTLSQQRKSMIGARISEFSFEKVKSAILNAENSSFLNGGGDNGWTASLDWIIKPNNFPKVLEGKYNHDTKPQGRDSPQRKEVDYPDYTGIGALSPADQAREILRRKRENDSR